MLFQRFFVWFILLKSECNDYSPAPAPGSVPAAPGTLPAAPAVVLKVSTQARTFLCSKGFCYSRTPAAPGTPPAPGNVPVPPIGPAPGEPARKENVRIRFLKFKIVIVRGLRDDTHEQQ